MKEGIVWCPHCHEPHKLTERFCPSTGRSLEQRLHDRGPRDSYIRKREHPLVGTIIDNKFEVLRRIGVGGMAEVFEAHNLILNRSVAIKIVAGTNTDAAARLRQEARLIALMQHPNICDLYDIGTMPDGNPYLVLERLTGETLHSCLRRGRRGLSETIEMFTQILSGAQHAHAAGVIHRDLKPANVFLVERVGCRPLVKLLDFGLAKDLSARQNRMTQPGRACGTPHYMSPEQLCGKPIDARSDLFSIALMLFETLTGRHAFHATALVEITLRIAYEESQELGRLRRLVPPALADLVERTLHKDPAKRPRTAIEMQTALASIDVGEDEEPSSSQDSAASFPRISLDSSYSSG